MQQTNSSGVNDPFNLTRFLKAQEEVYNSVISELKAGRKRTHWMWFIFPQIDGLAQSSTSRHYAIKSSEETQAYLDHPILGKRLKECAELVLAVKEQSASKIFGYPDDLKLKSSLTLFSNVKNADPIFSLVLDKYFAGHSDSRTLALLEAVK